MKIAVLYYSRGGTTRRMAQAICRLGGTVHVYDTMELYLARRP